MNVFAAACAACNRSGSTSAASIDSDTSMATITVARSRGTRTTLVGWANPTDSTIRATRVTALATCRRQPERFGTTDSSRSADARRAAYTRRRVCMNR